MKNNGNIPRFQLINGGNTPRPETVLNEQEERVTCYVCLNHEGIDTVEMIPISTMVVRKGNELREIVKKMACLNCLLRGRKTYIT